MPPRPAGRALVRSEEAESGRLSYRLPHVPSFARLTSLASSPVADLVIAAALTAVNVLAVTHPAGVPGAAVLVVTVAEAAPVVLWRRLPLAALTVTALAALVGVPLGLPPAIAGFAAILLSLGSTANAFGPRVSIPAVAVIMAGTLVVVREAGPIGIGFQLA